jgi:LmbE family N-acetylglucosaminyl deacetylase
MRGLTLPGDGDAPLNVLAVGAHADDIEIGAGGLLLELAAARPGLEVTWVVLSGDDE